MNLLCVIIEVIASYIYKERIELYGWIWGSHFHEFLIMLQHCGMFAKFGVPRLQRLCETM
jgi:hypothetical protein